MKKIWNNSTAYNLLKLYVDATTRKGYSGIEVRGTDNIPSDAPVIFVANHCNTLMDALLVLQANRFPSAYGARADIFRNPKVASFLRFLRILPLSRARDGRSAVESNYAIFDEIVDCIGHGVPFCIFPEGTHRMKHSLLPLKKGAFRVAVQAAQDLGRTVHLVPVGIDLESYTDYMKHCTMTFGKSIPVEADSDINVLKEKTADALMGLFTYFPDDENYDAAFAEYERTHSRSPKAVDKLLAVATGLLLPFVTAMCWPILLLSLVLCSRLKDKAWRNTMRFSSRLVLLPVCILLTAVPLFVKGNIIAGLIAIFVPGAAHRLFYRIINYIRFAFGK